MTDHAQHFFEMAAAAVAEARLDMALPGAAEVSGLLAAMGHQAGDPAPTRSHRAAMLRVAGRLARLFQLHGPDAPGLAFMGAEVDPHLPGLGPFSASGVGESFRPAFEGCIGEAVELLSQVEQPGDVVLHAAPDTTTDAELRILVQSLLAEGQHSTDTTVDWVEATRLGDGATCLLPADLLLRRDPARRVLTPPGPLSIGCGAGESLAAAMLHGLFEVVERDAVALWWEGGVRGRMLPLARTGPDAATVLLAAARAGGNARPTWLLDITSDLGIPCVAAVSCAQDGSAMACGTAARFTTEAAAKSAILEMTQMELAHHVVAAKRIERGDAGLNAADRNHLRRSVEINAYKCMLLHPLPPSSGANRAEFVESTPEQMLDHLVAHLTRHGFVAYARDLTRPGIAVPAAVVHCPGLQSWPSRVINRRLQSAILHTGGGAMYTEGVPLM